MMNEKINPLLDIKFQDLINAILDHDVNELNKVCKELSELHRSLLNKVKINELTLKSLSALGVTDCLEFKEITDETVKLKEAIDSITEFSPKIESAISTLKEET